jgi:hypothetical protein
MSIVDEIAEFIGLWGKLQEVTLTDQPDQIIWKWTSHGMYTSKLAYEVQFKGS